MPLLGEEQRPFCPDYPSTTQSFGEILRLPLPVVHSVFSALRQQQLVEVKGMVGNDYRVFNRVAGAPPRPNASRSAIPASPRCSSKLIPTRCACRLPRSQSLATRCGRSPIWWLPIPCWTSSVPALVQQLCIFAVRAYRERQEQPD
jgi:hypothetical protein